MLAGMYLVISDAQTRHCPNGTVANMSLGASLSWVMNFAARDMVDAGIFLAVAAGNSAEDLRDTSPASEPSVCTAGATDKKDAAAYFSNYGELLDVYAPGVDIQSSYIGEKDATVSRLSLLLHLEPSGSAPRRCSACVDSFAFFSIRIPC